MNGKSVGVVHFRQTIDGATYYIKDAPIDIFSNRHLDGRSLSDYFLASCEAIGGVHGDGTNGVFTNVLLYFHDYFLPVFAGDLKGLINLWKLIIRGIETDVHYWTDDLGNLALYLSHEKCFYWHSITAIL